MRISDWSSDVCSSDLLSGAADVDRHGHLRAAGARDAGKAPRDAAALPGATASPGSLAPTIRIRCVMRSSFRPHQVGAARSAMWCRSEEHTSELQSLMRISYAVFCLKKKKD